MSIELLPIASGAASSIDFTLDGLTVVFLTATGGDIPYTAKVVLEIKDSHGNYSPIATLYSVQSSGIPGEGTYRVTREDNGAVVGVEKSA